MAHQTMQKFGYPDTVICEYEYWSVQMRRKQATLGALVLIGKEDVTSISDLSAEAFAELKGVTADLEATLGTLFSFDKVNYLMLMMVDPQVHYHVLPRYESSREFENHEFIDPAWPGPPDIKYTNEVSDDVLESIQAKIKQAWVCKS